MKFEKLERNVDYSSKEKSESSLMDVARNIANKRGFRALAASALFLGFGRQSLAENNSRESSTLKTTYEWQGSEENNSSSEKTASFEKERTSMEVVKLGFNVNYGSDQAKISELDSETIGRQFNDFLNNINSKNFKIVAASDWKVFSSCDERPTSNWGKEGNKALAQERAFSVQKILQEKLKDFNSSNLSAEKIELIKNKAITTNIASSDTDHPGETRIVDLLNEEKGKKYSEEDVKELKKDNPELYSQLLASNRVSQFIAEIPNSRITPDMINEPIKKSTPEIIKPVIDKIDNHESKTVITDLKNYNSTLFLFDDSPSMLNSKKELAKDIVGEIGDIKTEKNLQVFVGHFSDRLSAVDKVNKLENINKEIEKTVGAGSSSERATSALLAALEKFKSKVKVEEKNLIMVSTDEALQGVTKKELNEVNDLANKYNIEIVFNLYMPKNQGGGRVEITLAEVIKSYDLKYQKEVSKLYVDAENYLKDLEIKITQSISRQAKGNDSRELKEHISYLKEAHLNQLKQLESIKNKSLILTDFTSGSKTVKLSY